MIPTDLIDKLEHTYRMVASLGAGLSEDQWKLPTECPGWTVQDNLSHIIGTERMLQGLDRTAHRAADVSVAKNSMGVANEHEVDARRASTGAEVLEEWRSVLAQRVATLRAGDAEYFARETQTPTGPGTVADFIHIRIMDIWVHEQDMRRAVGIEGDLDSPSAEHATDRLLRTFPMVVGKRAQAPEGSVVVLSLTGPVYRTLAVGISGGRAALVDPVPTATVVTASIEIGSANYARLATGRGDAATIAANAHVTGDPDLTAAILANLNIMI